MKLHIKISFYSLIFTIVAIPIILFANRGNSTLYFIPNILYKNPVGDSIHLKVGSYNLRYDPVADYETGNGWNSRKYPLSEVIRKHDFDIIGTQEGDFKQMADLISLLPGFDYFGYPYGGKNGLIHTASIVFKKSKLKIIDQGVFWYSERPDVKSIGWDATDQRICTWAKFEIIDSGLQFYFFNSHFYYRYKTARENSGKVMVEKIKEITNNESIPIISTGDLNSSPESSQMKDILTYLNDSYTVSKSSPSGPEGTNLGGGIFEGKPKNRIDYVLVNDLVEVLRYAVIDDKYNDNRYPSDHLPVFCHLVFIP